MAHHIKEVIFVTRGTRQMAHAALRQLAYLAARG